MHEGPPSSFSTNRRRICVACASQRPKETHVSTRRVRLARTSALRSCGAHFLLEFDDFALGVHFLLLDSYTMHTGLEREARTRDPMRRDDAAAA